MLSSPRFLTAIVCGSALVAAPLAHHTVPADPCAIARTQKAAGSVTGEITPAEVCRDLSVLADDSLEGRGTGTRGGAKAARFIAEQMRAAGLEPGGDSGYFQRVPLLVTASTRDGVTRTSVQAIASFAARDTFPTARRGLAVNVIGILRGTDPVLEDSVVLVDAHYDHLGIRPGRPVDVDSIRAAKAAAAPIEAAFEKYVADNKLQSTRPTAEQLAKIREFQKRIADAPVNMDSVRREHPVARLDSIYNGADDDASGTVAVIEIARSLAKMPHPKRTIVFVATTGEEVGLIGTRWYIAHPAVPLKSMEANLEIEMIGRPDSLAGGPGRAWLTGFDRSTMGPSFAAAGLPIVADKRLDQQFFQRSDNIAFAEMGIPAHTLSTFNMHSDYHQLTDEIEFVDFAHMAGVINVATRAVSLLANGPPPHWNPGGQPHARGGPGTR